MSALEGSMKPRFIGGIAVAAAVAAIALTPVAAQRGGQQLAPDNAPTPRMTDGHPDLNGWWGGGGGFGGGRTLSGLTDGKGNITLQLNARPEGAALCTASGQLATHFQRGSGIGQPAGAHKAIYKGQDSGQ